MYNILNCHGFGNTGFMDIGGGCMKSRLGLVILFFVICLLRKWGAEEIGMAFSFIFALIGGIGSYLLIVFFTGSFKLALFIGLIAGAACGYGFGIMIGDDGGGDY